MAKAVLGTKRSCTECGAKFYDLMKNPIVCPKCGTNYELEVLAPPSKSSGAAKPVQEEVEVAAPAEEAAVLVTLEEAEAEQASTGAKGAAVPEDEAQIEEAIADAPAASEDDTFLEVVEEEETDVTNLIDGEIEEEEEP